MKRTCEQPIQLLFDVGDDCRKCLQAVELARKWRRLLHDDRHQPRDLLRDQRQLAARLVLAGDEGGAVLRPGLDQTGAVERSGNDLIAQVLETVPRVRERRHRRGLDLRRLQRRQALLQELDLFLQLQPEQPAQSFAMLSEGLVGVVEDFDRAVRAVIDERRVAHQRRAAAADLEQIGQLAEVPVGDLVGEALRDFRILLRELLEGLLRLRAQFRAQVREVASHAELPAVLVDDLEVHQEVRRQRLELEVRGLRDEAAL